jgi:cytochrome c-type biogenesis protein CcmH/NrfF
MLLLAALATAASLPASALAQEPPRSGATLRVAPEARKAIDMLRSPFCPGEMLAVCPSEGGAMLRDSIQRMAEAGLKADSIVSIVLARFGPEYRAQPLASGTGLWAWVLPPAALLLGFGVVGVVLAHRRRTMEGVPVTVPEDLDPATEARLKAAMKEMDEAEEPDF